VQLPFLPAVVPHPSRDPNAVALAASQGSVASENHAKPTVAKDDARLMASVPLI